jgi:hypothetical protein
MFSANIAVTKPWSVPTYFNQTSPPHLSQYDTLQSCSTNLSIPKCSAVLWTDLVPVTGPVLWEVTDLRDRETTFVTIESSTVACKFRQPTDDNASGGNKSADKLASVFITWGLPVVASCSKFPHQSYANHFHKYCTVTAATGTPVPEPLPTLGPRKEFLWFVGETMQ